MTPLDHQARAENLIRAHQLTSDALIDAVANMDETAVATLLLPLDTTALHALAIVLAAKSPNRHHTIDALDEAVRVAANLFNTTPAQVRSRSGHREDLDARAVVVYACGLLGFSQGAIGRTICRDRTSVIAGQARVGTTPRLRGVAERIAAQLGWDREDVA